MKTTIDIEVRYAETDQMGVVYHSNYIIWFEVFRGEYLKKRNINYSLLEKEGVFVPVLKVECNYKSPAKYGDIVEVSGEIVEISRTRFTFQYEIKRKNTEELLVIGKTEHLFTNSDLKPINIKKTSPITWEKLEKKEV